MIDFGVVDEVLGEEDAEELEAAFERYEKPTKSQSSEIEGLENAIKYSVDAIKDEEKEFEPTTALHHYATTKSFDEVDELETLLSEEAFVDSILVDFSNKRQNTDIYESSNLNQGIDHHIKSVRLLEDNIDLSDQAIAELGSWGQQLQDEVSTLRSTINQTKRKVSQEVAETLLNGEAPNSSGISNIASQKYRKANISKPNCPKNLANEMLQYFVDERIRFSEETGIKNTVDNQDEQDSQPQTYQESNLRLDEDKIPGLKNNERLVKVGAKYQAHNEEYDLGVDQVREYVKEVRNKVQGKDLETTSLEGKGLDEGKRMYRELEKIAESEEYNLDEVVGSGAGSRQKINTLLAEINYVAENCFEEKKVTKKV